MFGYLLNNFWNFSIVWRTIFLFLYCDLLFNFFIRKLSFVFFVSIIIVLFFLEFRLRVLKFMMIIYHIRTKILDICNFLLQHLSLLKNLFLDWPDQDCLQVFLMVYGFQVFIFVERFKQAKKLFFISFQYFKYSIKDKK